MLMANVLARIDRKREELEMVKRDLKRVDRLIENLQDQKKMIQREIKDLEFQIEELEEELDG